MKYFAHDTAIVETESIGNGCKIWAFSHICRGASIGTNCIIGEGVYIGPNVIVGDNCKIQNHSLIYEGVVIESNVFIGPNTITTNDTLPSVFGDWRAEGRFKETIFKEGCSVGANSTIVCGVTVGDYSLVGAGSVVTKDVPNKTVVYGNPAKIARKIQ